MCAPGHAEVSRTLRGEGLPLRFSPAQAILAKDALFIVFIDLRCCFKRRVDCHALGKPLEVRPSVVTPQALHDGAGQLQLERISFS